MVMNAGLPICGTFEVFCGSKVLRTSCDTEGSFEGTNTVVDVMGFQSTLSSVRDRRTLTLKHTFDCDDAPVQVYAKRLTPRGSNDTLAPRTVHDERFLFRQTLDPSQQYPGFAGFIEDEQRALGVALCGTFDFPGSCSNTITLAGAKCTFQGVRTAFQATHAHQMSPRLYAGEELVANVSFTARFQSCDVHRRAVVLRFDRRSPFSRNSLVTFHKNLFSSKQELIGESVRFIKGISYAETARDLCLDFSPGDMVATLSMSFQSMVIRCTRTRLVMKDPYTGVDGDILVSTLGVYRLWALPGHVFASGTVIDVMDDSGKDVGANGTMAVLPLAGNDPVSFCLSFEQSLQTVPPQRGTYHGRPSSDVVKMVSAFSAHVVEADYGKKEVRLSRQYCGDAMEGVKLYRVPMKPAKPKEEAFTCPESYSILPGTLCALNGSNIFVTTMDLRKDVFPGDGVLVGGLDCVVESTASARLDVKCPTLLDGFYISSQSGCSMHGCLRSKTSDYVQSKLTELSRRTMKCTDLQCVEEAQKIQCAFSLLHGRALPQFCTQTQHINMTIHVVMASSREQVAVPATKADTVNRVVARILWRENLDARKAYVLQKTFGDHSILSDDQKSLGEYGVEDGDVFRFGAEDEFKEWGFFT